MRYGKLVFCGMLVCSIFGSLPTLATTYSHDATVQFTFNSEISVVIDTADIEILDLAPGTSSDSNVVGITISTNNVVGYTASATVGNATYNTTNMTHTNGTNAFTSLAENASEYSLSTDNTWGYTTSLDNGSSWANFSGLPIYTDTPKEIAKTTSPADDAIKFKINAKASTSQAAGDYKNVINFTVVANVPPKTIDDVLDEDPNTPTDPETHRPIIQAITEDVCDEVEAIDESSLVTDIRDHKDYWVAKLRDGKCWMTQNLDFNIPSTALSSTTTDLTQYGVGGYTSTDGYTKSGNIIYWTPMRATFATSSITSGTVTGWADDVTHPYSVDPGNWYSTDVWYDESNDYNYLAGNAGNRFSTDPYPENGLHGHVGNYYNWPAAIATNNASSYTDSTYQDPTESPQNSVCPANWQLPVMAQYSNYEVGANDYYNLGYLYNSAYNDEHISESPTWFNRTGWITYAGNQSSAGNNGLYWSSTVANDQSAYDIYFHHWGFNARNYYTKSNGGAIRCVGRQSPKYTISYNANGGSGSMPSQEAKVGKTVTLVQNRYTRSGYKFMGWNTVDTGAGIGYGDEDDFTNSNPVATIILYAQWEEDISGQGGGGYAGKTLARAYEEAYMHNSGNFEGHRGLFVPEKDNQGNYTGRYFEADSEDDYSGIPAKDLRFAMQDADLLVDNEKICERTTVIGSEVYLLDLRDYKSYWAVKLKDGHCWMSQNLDFNVSGPLTSLDSDINDIGIGGYTTSTGYSQNGNVITWTPTITTSTPNANGTATWANGTEYGYSLDPGNWYMDGSTSNTHLADNFLSTGGTRGYVRKDYPYDTIGTHGHVGNYYAYATAIATNHVSSYLNMDAYNDSSKAPNNSICPKNWRLAVESSQTKEYSDLINLYDVTITNHPDRLVNSPMYYIESGIFLGSQDLVGVYGIYLSSVYHYDGSQNLGFGLEIGFSNNVIRTELVNYTGFNHGPGKSVRCLMR